MLINQGSEMSDSDNEAVNDEENFSQFECRACLKFVSKGFYNIYQPWNAPWVGMQNTVADDLAKIANVELAESDPHSKVMCEKCCILLHNACQFIATVKRSNEILRLRRCSYEVPIEINDKTWPKPIQLEKNMNDSVLITAMDVEVKQEVVSDDEYDGMNGMDEGFRPDLGIDIKDEPEEMEQPPIKVTVNGTISTDQMGGHNLIIANGFAIYEDEEYLDVMVKEERISEDEDQGPFDLSPECMLCSKTFFSVSGLKAHVISQHSYKSVKRKTVNSTSPEKNPSRYTCGTCRRSFVTSTDLMVHETCHNKAICYSCNANFDTFDQLINHRKRCKAILNKEVSKPKLLEDVIRLPPNMQIRPVEESSLKKETQKCSICAEEFSDSYYMKIHHEVHHENDPVPHSEKVDESELEKTEANKSVTVDNKKETENLQRMFEQTEICPQKANRKEKEDIISSENKIELAEKTDQKLEQITHNLCTKTEKSKQADNNDGKEKNVPSKQNDRTKSNSEPRDDSTLSVESEETESLVKSVQKDDEQVEQSDCTNHDLKHIEYIKQVETKKSNNKESKDKNREHSTKHNKENEQTEKIDKRENKEEKLTSKGSENAEESGVVVDVSEQKQTCEKNKQEETNGGAESDLTVKSELGQTELQVNNDEVKTETIESISAEK